MLSSKLGVLLAFWLALLLVTADGHRCRRKSRFSQHLATRSTVRFHELVRRVRQDAEDRIRAWCRRTMGVMNPRRTRIEKQGRNTKEPEQERKRIPYRPPHLISKMQRVKTIDDFVRVFRVNGMQKSYVTSPEIMTLSCAKSGRCNPGLSSTVKYTLMGTSQNAEAVMDFRMDDTSCKPRTVIHTLPLPELANFVYYPSCVEAQRCGGCCTENINFACGPQLTYLEKRAVYQIFYNNTWKATTANIEHHRTCKCHCLYSQKDCLPTQTFDPRNCQCECRRRQSCGPNKQWSQGYCDCVCIRKLPCTKHQIWDTSVCRCVCPSDPCPQGMYRDRNTCECRT